MQSFILFFRPVYTDIRYAAHGSPYYSPVLLDGLLELNRAELEAATDVQVNMIKINLCSDETCEEGCVTRHYVSSDDVSTLVNANKTSLLTVTVKHERQCICAARNFDEPETCQTLHCHNGGLCKDNWEPHPYCDCAQVSFRWFEI